MLALTLLLSAATVLASTHEQRGHHAAVAKRRETSLEARDSFDNMRMTWYGTNTGADACTGKDHSDDDWYIAMGTNQFGDGGNCCGKKLRIDYNGKSAIVQCVDECATCPQYGSIDLTKGVFSYLTNNDLDLGEFYADWSYVSSSSSLGPTGSGGDDDDDDDDTTTTKKKTTTTTHKTTATPKAAVTTHKTTSTTHKTTSTTHSSSKATSSAKPSSSKASSSAKSSAKPTSSSTSAVSEPTEGVANAGSDAGTSAGSDTDGDDTGNISGALTGTGGAASVGVSGFFVAGAAIFMAALAL